ncbi:hypothetical protein NEF87_003906 [Candidatus Lokiarchaeum ossiferum]|uniref:MarR family transcriptional regulator n=1 Tax=Candidatus Lokiarchaeum ossiferum TaxID=2951803 RepID=A0ABY6HVR6_9ARCH|nr:hypothetical protein NEF87_003906 [Candidatus Lokiarchaeum sp. B-35]
MKNMYNHDFRFEGKIKSFEEILTEFYSHIAKLNGRKVKTAVIYAYFLLYKRLTQDNVQTLTNYSKGTISNVLNYLHDGNVIAKETIPGTHLQEYSSLMYYPKLDYITFEENLDNINEAQSFTKKNILLLQQKQLLDGGLLLIHRLEDLVYFTEFRQAAKLGKRFELDLARLDNPIPPLNPHFDPEIEEIEKKICKYFTDSDFFEDSDKKKASIFSYLMTRCHLSSTKLCELTGISLPTVNKKLRELAIERFIQPNLTKDGYVLKNIAISFRLFRHYYHEQLMGWIPRLQAVQDQLRDPKQKLVFLKGYPEMYTLIDRILFDLKGLKTWFNEVAERRKKIQELNSLKPDI